MTDSYQLQYSGQQLSKRIGMIPVFFSKWTPLNMPEGWVKSTGSFLQGSQYPEQYAYILKILNEEITNSGISVKSISDTYDDYDIVVDTENNAFRLPLLNGEENIATDNRVDDPGIVTASKTPPITWVAPYNCVYKLNATLKSSTDTLYIGKGHRDYGIRVHADRYANIETLIELYRGDRMYIGYSSGVIKTVNVEHIYKCKGYGDLWFFLG